MDVNSFYTQKTAQSGGQSNQASVQVLKGGSGIFAAGMAGASFMDMIFARSIANRLHDITNDETGAGTALAMSGVTGSADAINGGDPALWDTALTDMDGHGVMIETMLDHKEGKTDTLSGQQILQSMLNTADGQASSKKMNSKAIAALNNALQSLLNGSPEEAASIFKHSKDEILQFVPGHDDASADSLIATGLTINDLSRLLQDIANGDEQGEGLAGFISIMNPDAKKEEIFTPRGAVMPQTAKTPDDALLSKLSSLLAASGEDDGTGIFTENGKNKNTDFGSILKIMERAQAEAAAKGKNAPALDKAIAHIQTMSAGNSAVQMSAAAQNAFLGEIFAAFETSDVFPEGFDAAQNAASGSPISSTLAQITSIITNVQQAGHPHPASAAVAHIVAKTSGKGENRNFTIQLDPPELGRVEIRLSFAKDKAMKAHLVVEKTETHLMLQRDSQLLERSLQEAGIDTNGSSLSFELAQDGHLFDHGQKDQSGNSGAGGGGSNAEAAEEDVVIETTMDWFTDPATGLTRYNLLV